MGVSAEQVYLCSQYTYSRMNTCSLNSAFVREKDDRKPVAQSSSVSGGKTIIRFLAKLI
jgi:hypothetical protein